MGKYKEEGLQFSWTGFQETQCYICNKHMELPDVNFSSTYRSLNAKIIKMKNDKWSSDKHLYFDACVICTQRMIAHFGTYEQMLEFWEMIKEKSIYYDFSKVLIPIGESVEFFNDV